MTKPSFYSRPQILLHWLIAALILAAWWTGDSMGRLFNQRIEQNLDPIANATPHIWLGVAVFALVLIRLVLRLTRGAPGHATPDRRWMNLTASLGHWAFTP